MSVETTLAHTAKQIPLLQMTVVTKLLHMIIVTTLLHIIIVTTLQHMIIVTTLLHIIIVTTLLHTVIIIPTSLTTGWHIGNILTAYLLIIIIVIIRRKSLNSPKAKSVSLFQLSAATAWPGVLSLDLLSQTFWPVSCRPISDLLDLQRMIKPPGWYR